jgi:hypothetical protein
VVSNLSDYADIQYSTPPEPIERTLAPGVAEQFSKLPDESKIAFRRALEGAGFTPESILAPLGPPPKPTAAVVPAIDAPPSPEGYDTLRHDPNVTSGLTIQETVTLDKEAREAFHKVAWPDAWLRYPRGQASWMTSIVSSL